jgi:hypothetical protein
VGRSPRSSSPDGKWRDLAWLPACSRSGGAVAISECTIVCVYGCHYTYTYFESTFHSLDTWCLPRTLSIMIWFVNSSQGEIIPSIHFNTNGRINKHSQCHPRNSMRDWYFNVPWSWCGNPNPPAIFTILELKGGHIKMVLSWECLKFCHRIFVWRMYEELQTFMSEVLSDVSSRLDRQLSEVWS